MKTQIRHFSLINLCLLALTLVIPGNTRVARAGLSNPQLLAQNSYPQSLREDYLKSCKGRAAREGVSAEQAQKLCSCTLRRFQNRFTREQFVALNRRAAQTRRTPQAFSEIGMACYRELSR
ncbi:hypothetical protein IQ249_10575 [Lusitaniella coriacea LEGE 07157]|uniref:Uncharacterized protein n=1 Tax=Lusitaniella coriacea LEGE 07157 TaxID=945747 RepID=A0A8J7ISR0_9CYAN|nr:hypothetical protein [Lusitaniella coriacea]MBE9116342.1 hypothetical protein [Lusitaniella coriacea LEGE 07157]